MMAMALTLTLLSLRTWLGVRQATHHRRRLHQQQKPMASLTFVSAALSWKIHHVQLRMSAYSMVEKRQVRTSLLYRLRRQHVTQDAFGKGIESAQPALDIREDKTWENIHIHIGCRGGNDQEAHFTSSLSLGLFQQLRMMLDNFLHGNHQ
eukprot:scaffold1515_cov162-Amphora_coffeaeformis.AAC.5